MKLLPKKVNLLLVVGLLGLLLAIPAAAQEPGTGALDVRKIVDPAGSGHVFDFRVTGPNTDVTFQLTDRQRHTVGTTLESGVYTISEILDAGEVGWVTDILCDTVPPTVVVGASVSITIEPGATVLCSFKNTASPTSVQLADFSGVVKPDHILLSWETVSEIDNLGFNVYRSDAADGAQSLISATLIPANNPGATQGSSYSFQDSDVQPGVSYYYWLEDMDTAGQTSKAGPVAVTFLGPTSVGLNSFTAVAGTAPALLGLGGAAMAALAGLAVARRKQD